MGVAAMQELFGKPETKLNTIRYQKLKAKIAVSTTFVKPESLPPTEGATRYHSLRVYCQIMEWKGQFLDPLEWGWRLHEGKYIPKTTDISPAQEKLLKVVHCACTTGCGSQRCGCRKYGLPCTTVCGPCQTNGICQNVPLFDNDEMDDDDG